MYLESNMPYDLDCKKEIASKTAKTGTNLKAMDKIKKSKAINLSTKLSVLNTCIFSSILMWLQHMDYTKRLEKMDIDI